MQNQDLMPIRENMKWHFREHYQNLIHIIENGGLQNEKIIRSAKITCSKRRMKTVLFSFLLVFFVNIFALPPCPKNQTKSYHNCYGAKYFSDGSSYIGEFKDNKPQGLGTLTVANETKYVGEFNDGVYHGQGTITLANGDKYVGSFKDNKIHGRGTYTWADGREYVGENKYGVMHGKGTETYLNGDKYIGEYRDGKKHGYGTLTQADDYKYVGEWKYDKRDGHGTSSYPKGYKYIGDYKYDKKHGYGIIISPSGDKHGGEWIDGEIYASVQKNDFETLNPQGIKKRKNRDAVAIIIGIESYKNAPKSKFSNSDARAFYDYAIKALGVPRNKIQLLVDDKADDIDIYRTLENWLPLNVVQNKTDVYFFYSGHGLPSSDGKTLYVLPYGVDRDFLERTAVSKEFLVSSVQKVKPRSAVFFLDSCYSGSSRTGDSLMASARPLVIQTQDSMYPGNFTVFSASKPDQISFSNPSLRHGIFSFYLMKGLEGYADKNKDGKILANELDEYLQSSVSRSALSMNKRQNPQVVGNTGKVLVP